jgi:hypothetical protein
VNKAQLQKMVADSIKYADEQDAASQQRARSAGFDRRWDRLNYFMIALQAELAMHSPEAAALISQFQKRVIHGENALLPVAGDDGSAK